MDLTQAIEVIKAYLASGEPDVPDNVRTAATIFAEECRVLNERLTVCDSHLHNYQRSEAIRQATLQPELLRQYHKLDIRENWDRWSDAARQRNLPVPPALNYDAALRLSNAYEPEHKVAHLLQKLRKLVLERAPLLERLTVLRSLANAERTNLAWTEDLRAHERVRFREIQELLNDPEESKNPEVLDAIRAELDGEWKVQVPQELVQMLKRRNDELQRNAGQDVLRGLSPQLVDALNADDAPAIRKLSAKVKNIVKRYGLQSGSPVWRVLQDAEVWLERDDDRRKRQQTFEQAVDAIRLVLAEADDWDEARERYAQLLTFPEYPIPADVVQEYAAWGRRRQMVWVWAAGGAVIAVLSGVVLYFALVR